MAHFWNEQSFWEDDMRSSELTLSFDFEERDERMGSDIRYTARQEWDSNSLWTTTQPVPMSYHTGIMAPEGSAYGDPGLSFDGTSRRSSFCPPVTPEAVYDTSTPTQMSALLPTHTDQTVYQSPFNTEATYMGLHFPALDYKALEYKALDYNLMGAGTSLLNGTLDTSQEQPWGKSFPASQPSSQQQVVEDVPDLPAYENTTGRHTQETVESWPNHANYTWVPSDNTVSSENINNATGYSIDTTTYYYYKQSNSASVGPGDSKDSSQSTLQAPKPTKQCDPIQCERCDNIYTGEFGKSNMQRHFRQKHADGYRREYKCGVCGKIYKRIDALRIHKRSKHT